MILEDGYIPTHLTFRHKFAHAIYAGNDEIGFCGYLLEQPTVLIALELLRRAADALDGDHVTLIG